MALKVHQDPDSDHESVHHTPQGSCSGDEPPVDTALDSNSTSRSDDNVPSDSNTIFHKTVSGDSNLPGSDNSTPSGNSTPSDSSTPSGSSTASDNSTPFDTNVQSDPDVQPATSSQLATGVHDAPRRPHIIQYWYVFQKSHSQYADLLRSDMCYLIESPRATFPPIPKPDTPFLEEITHVHLRFDFETHDAPVNAIVQFAEHLHRALNTHAKLEKVTIEMLTTDGDGNVPGTAVVRHQEGTFTKAFLALVLNSIAQTGDRREGRSQVRVFHHESRVEKRSALHPVRTLTPKSLTKAVDRHQHATRITNIGKCILVNLATRTNQKNADELISKRGFWTEMWSTQTPNKTQLRTMRKAIVRKLAEATSLGRTQASSMVPSIDFWASDHTAGPVKKPTKSDVEYQASSTNAVRSENLFYQPLFFGATSYYVEGARNAVNWARWFEVETGHPLSEWVGCV